MRMGVFVLMSMVGLVSLYTFRVRFLQSPAEPGTSAMQSSRAAKTETPTYGKPVQ